MKNEKKSKNKNSNKEEINVKVFVERNSVINKNLELMLSDEEGSMQDILANKFKLNEKNCKVSFYFDEKGAINFFQEQRSVGKGLFKISPTKTIEAYFLVFDSNMPKEKVCYVIQNIAESVDWYNEYIT